MIKIIVYIIAAVLVIGWAIPYIIKKIRSAKNSKADDIDKLGKA